MLFRSRQISPLLQDFRFDIVSDSDIENVIDWVWEIDYYWIGSWQIRMHESSWRNYIRPEQSDVDKMLSGYQFHVILFTNPNRSKFSISDTRQTDAKMKRSFSAGLHQLKEKFPFTYRIMNAARDSTRRISVTSSMKDYSRCRQDFSALTLKKSRLVDVGVPPTVLRKSNVKSSVQIQHIRYLDIY